MTDLKNDDIKLEIYRLHQHEGLSVTEISNISGIARSTLCDFLNSDPSKRTYKDWWKSIEEKPFADGQLEPPENRRKKIQTKTIVLTSAQNNTFVNKDFLSALELYCSKREATLLIGTYTYNKTGFQNLQKEDGEWYDPLIEQYIFNESTLINDQIVWCGELNILPTAVNPLSGLYAYTKNLSGVIPHAKLRFESCPRPKYEEPKFLMSTGSVTKPNYIQQKAGQKAEFHHVYSAIIIEFDSDGNWFPRQLVADDNNGFYDLDKYYDKDGVQDNQKAEAIQWGDLHSEKKNQDVYDGSFINKDSLLDLLKPNYQFCHDTLDFTTRNHHNIKDMYFRYKSQIKTSDKVLDDIKDVVDTLKKLHRNYCQIVIVNSNHDQALLKWLSTADIRYDNVDNALFYHKCQVKILESILSNDDSFSIFKSCIDELFHNHGIKFLKEDEKFVICKEHGGISCENHGHLGVNGARGSVNSFTKIGVRTNSGHTHSPAIIEGCYVAGVSGNLDMGYNKGFTSWANAHIVTYPNGKRQLIIMRGNKYKVY